VGKRRNLIWNTLRGINVHEAYQKVYGQGGVVMQVAAEAKKGNRVGAREIIYQIRPAMQAFTIYQPLNPEISRLRLTPVHDLARVARRAPASRRGHSKRWPPPKIVSTLI